MGTRPTAKHPPSILKAADALLWWVMVMVVFGPRVKVPSFVQNVWLSVDRT